MSGYFAGCTGYTYAYGAGLGGLTHAAWALPGGTGNIFPSEYGVHLYDEDSATQGATATVYHKDYVISDVDLNDTFETWRKKTNNEIIEKLNLLHVYGATPGDGMMIGLGTGGTLAVAFSGNVLRTHSTFCNNVSIGSSLKVAGTAVGSVDAPTTVRGSQDGISDDAYLMNENIIVLNTNENSTIGEDYVGLLVGGRGTGPNPTSIDNSGGTWGSGDINDTFGFDRPYWMHKNNMWQTKEGLWLEGSLKHNEVFTRLVGEYPAGGPADADDAIDVGTTGPYYPYGPYGYTGDLIADAYKDIDKGPSAGVVRMFFGPTLAGHNFLDIDGRGGKSGKTGDIWKGVAGATGALVIGNTGGGLLEFDTDGFVNIYKGANKKRIVKKDHGFVFGNVIRYSGTTQGFTFASAAGQNELHGDFVRAAESIGVVSKIVNSYTFDLTMIGEVEGTKAEWNTALVENHTEGLVPGCVYFLSVYGGDDRGKIQHAEPDVAGYVNKPVLIATGVTSGVVMPYRGQYNSPTGCTGSNVGGAGGAGGSGSEKIQFDISYVPAQQSFSEGDLICQSNAKSSGFDLADHRDFNKSHVFGMVTLVNSTAGFIRVCTHGAVTLIEKKFSVGAGPYYLHENGQAVRAFSSGNYSVKVFDALSPTRVIINIDTPSMGGSNPEEMGAGTFKRRGDSSAPIGSSLRLLGPTGATGTTYDNALRVNKNELINGDFGIWQRGVGLTGANTAGTTGYTGNSNTYFADRWLRVSQSATGANNPFTGKCGGTSRAFDFKLDRGVFDRKQTVVEGHPDYYAIIRGAITYAGGTNSNEWSRVEQRIEDCTSFAGEVMTVSFYARGSETGDCHVAWIQNLAGTTGAAPGVTFGGNYVASHPLGVSGHEFITPITDFRVGTDWARYNFAFFSPEISNAAGASGGNHSVQRGISADHFTSVAFYTQLTGLPDGTHKNINFGNDLHLSQVKLERGNVATAFNRVNPNEELRRCQRFYQTSYVYGEYPTTNTMKNISDSKSATTPDTSGVQFMVPGTFLYVYEFPERMRITPTQCGLYSPTGLADEGFNRDAGKDMRLTSGTVSSLGEQRKTSGNAKNVSCDTDTPNAIEIKVLRGAAKLDTIVVHYYADAEFNNAMPSPVDRYTLGKGT